MILPWHTSLYSKRKMAIEAAFRRFDDEVLTPWLFTKERGMSVVNCRGQSIKFPAGETDGSLRTAFWGDFIGAEIERVITSQLAYTAKECDFYPDLCTKALHETRGLLYKFM